MIAATDTFEDKSNQERFKNQPNWCRLCKNKDTIESRSHLLTYCPTTIHLLSNFSENIKSISLTKYNEFCQLHPDSRWLWILGGGFIKSTSDSHSNRYRMNLPTRAFTKGPNVRTGIDKTNPQQCLDAYNEFKFIESNLPKNNLTVFTDGSVKENKAGSASIIYHQNKVIHEIVSPIGDLPIAYAELFAIYSFLKYLRNDTVLQEKLIQEEKQHYPVHIFTDRISAQEILCQNAVSKDNFYLIEEIKNLANNLTNFQFFIHWIPSHTENTSFGRLPIKGNARADKLADEARLLANNFDTTTNLNLVRNKLLESSATLISKINDFLSNIPSPSYDGPSSDDFRSSDAIQDSSSNRIIL
jgi:ribonuclease HI